MKSSRFEWYAMTALIATVVYCLACMYPPAWSPDSKKVVFPILGDKGIVGLVMTDLKGNPIREVARVDTNKSGAMVSPAAWSPDGKWISFLQLEPGTNEATGSGVGALMLQDAATGKQKSIFRIEYAEQEERDFVFGPGWLEDSKALAVGRIADSNAAIIVVGIDGTIRKEIQIPADKWACSSASLSPDGEHIAWLQKQDESKTFLVFLRSLKSGGERLLGTNVVEKAADIIARPAWSADSRLLYIPASDSGTGRVVQVDIRKMRTTIIFEKPGCRIFGIDVAAKAKTVAVSFGRSDTIGIEVLDVGKGRIVPVHFGLCLSTSLSPDGQWVAFCPAGKDDGKETYGGCIVSADGAQMNFFLPTPEFGAVVGDIVKNRLAEAAEAAGIKLQGEVAPGEKGVEAIAAMCDRAVRSKDVPIFREAIAYAKAELLLKAASDHPEHVGAAEKAVKAFLKAYPKHVLGPELKEKLDSLTRPKQGFFREDRDGASAFIRFRRDEPSPSALSGAAGGLDLRRAGDCAPCHSESGGKLFLTRC